MDFTIISNVKKNEFTSTDEWAVQSNEEHNQGVANWAELFAGEFDCADWGKVIGLLHDKGKEKKDFQNYIRKTSGYEPNAPSWKDKTHAYVGALLAQRYYGCLSVFLSNPIMGHHAGLYDYGDFETQMKLPLPLEINSEWQNINLTVPSRLSSLNAFDFHHFVRLLYSCLVDADFLDTERFMNEGNAALRGQKDDLQQLSVKLESYLTALAIKSIDSPVNRIRNIIQKKCLEKSKETPGFYSLTVPTGGGKTISSLVWAINHAKEFHKKRIIIAIPYTSIIVQTAEVLRNIFGEENVLEHHSNTDFDDIADAELKLKMKLATENWDYPIIVTTNVQLFESMFSNKPSACRKLHNLCNSVLILDEVQTLPLEYLQPIVDGLKTFQRCFGTTVLFTTASLPALKGDCKGSGLAMLNGIKDIYEIIPGSLCLHDKLRRTNLYFDKERSDYDTIARRLSQYDRVLCIVNTRKDAQEIYSRLPDEGITLHLSRMMCPKHLSETIALVKKLLKDENCKIIRVIATQLIEAGVDIDFPVVFRQEAGLDSILQAAGRCNREGKLAMGTTYVFKLHRPLPLGYISNSVDAQTTLLQTQPDADWFAPETMRSFFVQLYSRTQNFDKADIRTLLYKPREFCFKTAALNFHLIENEGKGIIVNYDDSLSLVEELKQKGPNYLLMKRLGQYMVHVHDRDFNMLLHGGFAEEIIKGVYVMSDRDQYSEKLGLIVENHWLDEILIK